MVNHSTSVAHVLIAVPYDWHRELCQFLEQKGVSVIMASTRDEAVQIAQSQLLRGIITIGEWATVDNDNNIPGLVGNSDGKTPSVMLVSRDGFSRFFQWYNAHYSPMEEYCHVPFSTEELWACMKRVGMIEAHESED